MTTAMEKAEAWLAHQRKQTLGVRIRYRRGGFSTECIAVPGETRCEEPIDDAGSTVRRSYRDWLIVAADLTGPQAARIVPQLGDVIEELRPDGDPILHQVAQIGEEPCWRWSGRQNIVRRVHTRDRTVV